MSEWDEGDQVPTPSTCIAWTGVAWRGVVGGCDSPFHRCRNIWEQVQVGRKYNGRKGAGVGRRLEKRGGNPRTKGPVTPWGLWLAWRIRGLPWEKTILSKMAEKPGQGVDHLFRHLQQWQYGGTSVGSLQAAGHCLKVKEGEKERETEAEKRERSPHFSEYMNHSLKTPRKIWETFKGLTSCSHDVGAQSYPFFRHWWWCGHMLVCRLLNPETPGWQ